jgi:hypothetical protein
MRSLVSQLTRTEKVDHRLKSGLFNFIEHMSHSIFGLLDSDNEEFYNNKITQLEGEQSELIKLSREQMIVVKSTLKSVNKTLNDVTSNESIFRKGLLEIKKFINKENVKIKDKYEYTAMLVALNDHAIQIK